MYSKEEKKKLAVDFWDMFKQRCAVHPNLKFKKKPFILHRTKIKGVVLRFDIDRNNAKVVLELNNRSERFRLKAFEVLESYKTVVEQGFQNGLVWEFFHERPESGQEVCRIYTTLNNVDLHRQDQWPEIYNFFIENMLKLEDNFLQVRDILEDELQKFAQFTNTGLY